MLLDSEEVYATISGEFVYFGIASSDGGDLQCQYAETITAEFLNFPLGGASTYNNGFLQCPKWALTVQRNLAESIIRLTANGKQYVTNEATALSRGAYVPPCKTDINDDEIIFLYIANEHLLLNLGIVKQKLIG